MITALHLHFQTSKSPQGSVRGALVKAGFWRKGQMAFTLVEVMVAVMVLAITAVTVTQALLQLNRQAAISRLTNAAKAEALSRIQQVSQCAYDPTATPVVIPTILAVGTTTTAVDLGSSTTGLGSIPGTATWTVASLGTSNILSVKCTIAYTYLSKQLSYELFTYKSPD
ncbi:MAG: type II secretion system protein [Chthoniobacter sp.]|uniref:type II secretion system protein n=1 Tax=Chthoniobacter sp. TaxID=2510640 RepID=UPI0032A3DD2D